MRPNRIRLPFVAAVLGSLLGGPVSGQLIRNPGFEVRVDSTSLEAAAWTVGGRFPNGLDLWSEGYEVALDSAVHHGGNWSLRMRPVGTGVFGLATQSLDAEGLQGNIVRLSGFVRGEDLEGVGGAVLWLRVDGAEGLRSLDSNGEEWTSGSTDWTSFEVGGFVDPGAERVSLGVMFVGPGTAWFDDLVLEAVSPETLPPPSDSAVAYLNRALDLMQERSLRRDAIDWAFLRGSAIQRARGAQDTGGTHPAIRTALLSLGDHHSFFIEPDDVEALLSRNTAEARDRPGPSAEVLEGRFGYVRVPAFSGGTEDATQDYARQIQTLIARDDQARPCGWLVDLRHNLGGNVWPMLAGVGPLLGEGDAGYFVYPGGERVTWGYAGGASRMAGSRMVQVPDPYTLRPGSPPVAVLTDRGTASSGEVIATAFRGRPGTRSFGERTAGATTANASITLSDGAQLVLATAVFADRIGRTYDSGIVPDETIAASPPGTPLTADAVVRRALTWLSGQAQCRREIR